LILWKSSMKSIESSICYSQSHAVAFRLIIGIKIVVDKSNTL
jgi:hypothetical protein